MNLRGIVVVTVALIAGVGGFFWQTRRTTAISQPVVATEPELRWLQREFRLDDATIRHIADLHHAYAAECEAMCEALRASDAQVQRMMLESKVLTPELEATLARSNQLMFECQRKMLTHFYAVAREMPPAEAQRYLQQMTPVAAHPERSWMSLSP